MSAFEGTEGQDRENYSDNQDRESYVPDEGKRFELPEFGIVIETDGHGSGRLLRGFDDPFNLAGEEMDDYGEGARDALESLLLALASDGVDITTEPFQDGLRTTLDAIGNSF